MDVEPQGAIRPPAFAMGMILFLMVEVMYFAGLMTAHTVLKAQGGASWPPMGQARLPIGVTAVNTVILLLSGIFLFQACRQSEKKRVFLLAAILGGTVFLSIQGVEWVNLLGAGLTARSSLYGGIFYAIVGSHALHAVAGLALLVMLWTGKWADQIKVVGLYWYFVVGIWPLIFGIVYF